MTTRLLHKEWESTSANQKRPEVLLDSRCIWFHLAVFPCMKTRPNIRCVFLLCLLTFGVKFRLILYHLVLVILAVRIICRILNAKLNPSTNIFSIKEFTFAKTLFLCTVLNLKSVYFWNRQIRYLGWYDIWHNGFYEPETFWCGLSSLVITAVKYMEIWMLPLYIRDERHCHFFLSFLFSDYSFQSQIKTFTKKFSEKIGGNKRPVSCFLSPLFFSPETSLIKVFPYLHRSSLAYIHETKYHITSL